MGDSKPHVLERESLGVLQTALERLDASFASLPAAADSLTSAQPVGYVHSLFEVAIDVLTRAGGAEDKQALLGTMAETNLATISGQVDFTNPVSDDGGFDESRPSRFYRSASRPTNNATCSSSSPTRARNAAFSASNSTLRASSSAIRASPSTARPTMPPLISSTAMRQPSVLRAPPMAMRLVRWMASLRSRRPRWPSAIP